MIMPPWNMHPMQPSEQRMHILISGLEYDKVMNLL
jgi:hypothetical protein